MRSKFLNFADEVRFSFWFLPVLMVVGAIVLFWAMVYLDEVLDQPETGARRRVYTGHAEGAQALLSTIAGSIISVEVSLLALRILEVANTGAAPSSERL